MEVHHHAEPAAGAAPAHHGRTIIALEDGTLDVVDQSGKTIKQMTWETGKAYWLGVDPPDEEHGDMYRGKDPIEVIVVEMKK